jgi:hypothetical protein
VYFLLIPKTVSCAWTILLLDAQPIWSNWPRWPRKTLRNARNEGNKEAFYKIKKERCQTATAISQLDIYGRYDAAVSPLEQRC